jgi:DNA-binding transcriptional ArsR family regulator
MTQSMPVAAQGHFAYHHTMNVSHEAVGENHADAAVARIASAIGEPARARILFTLMDGHARTSTELAVVAEVSPSTASAHLNRLKAEHLIKVLAQGKHRFYSLEGPEVARALEGLSVLAGNHPDEFVPNTPSRLRAARTCYDHIAGTLGVALHDRFMALRWISIAGKQESDSYDLTPSGMRMFEALGIEVEPIQNSRRRFAYACLDWSERRPHIGGALGAALLNFALKRKWVARDLDSRILRITNAGSREMQARFGIRV